MKIGGEGENVTKTIEKELSCMGKAEGISMVAFDCNYYVFHCIEEGIVFHPHKR